MVDTVILQLVQVDQVVVEEMQFVVEQEIHLQQHLPKVMMAEQVEQVLEALEEVAVEEQVE